MAASSTIPESRFYSSPMKLFVVALLSSLKNLDNSTSKLVFRPLMHQPRIYAGAPAGVHVTTVHAYDPDRPRKKVEYNLPNVLDYKHFIVDKMSGNLSTATMINKTVGESYQVMVAAVSYGSSELEHLQIAVTEFNQFAPRFEQRNYTLELHPETNVDTVVLTVKASDPDPEPHNAEIYYILDQNTTSQYFTLNSLTGELTLSQPINESESLQNFGIFAEDGGSPKRWDYVSVFVAVKTLSAPQNVTVVSITQDSAIICWESPKYGDILGYVLKYYPVNSDTHFVVNVTISDRSSICETLENLTDDTVYKFVIYGWNTEEQGQKTELLEFRTSENWCNKVTCEPGVCISLQSEPWYECDCPVGFYGTSCEYFDPCSHNPCSNNGKCLNTTHNEYVCICAEDYSGPNCGSYNPCLHRRNPCENGATCEMTTNNTYICICAEGFYGRKCKYRDLCFSDPCSNGGTCNIINETTFMCSCPIGFTGAFCETDTDECESNPCLNSSTCVNQKGNFSCLCPDGFTGHLCEKSVQCSADRTDTEKGMFYWNATNHSTEVTVPCPFGSANSLPEASAFRSCILTNVSAIWGPVNASECKGKGIIVADELADELYTITKNPDSLNRETLEAAAQGIETISNFAVQDEKIAEGMLNVISNILDFNDNIVEQDENYTFSELTKNLLQIVDDYASNAVLKTGESLSVITPNVRVQAMDWSPTIENETETDIPHLKFTVPKDQEYQPVITTPETTVTSSRPPERQKVPMVKVFVPKEALQEAHRQLEGNVRVKFVVYYNDKLFQSKKLNLPDNDLNQQQQDSTSTFYKLKKNKEEPEYKAPVLQISVGNVTLKNLNKPLIYILPLKTKRDVLCVYWNEKDWRWSAEGLTTNHTKNYVICQSTHMTAFSVLLDVTPRSPKNKSHESIMSIISYIGCVLSIIGLSLTIITYVLFGCLNRDHPGKILANLCLSLLLMNVTFLLEALNPEIGGKTCAAVAVLLHYFVLTSLSWMCVEAINMYQLLVHVFASSETRFMLKRCVFAWGTPLIIVVLTASFRLSAYFEGLQHCMLSPLNSWIYYCAFLAPSCLILAVNFTVFVLVSRVIFTPRLTTKTSNNPSSLVTAAQVRGAFTVMILLGVTWVFGTMAFGEMKLIFQYAFCISNSLQGFLIFLVRCLLYPEARNAWFYLFKTGKFKKHRGVVPPGTVSFSNSQVCKNAASSTSQSSARNDFSEDSPNIALDSSLFNRKENAENNEKVHRNAHRLRSVSMNSSNQQLPSHHSNPRESRISFLQKNQNSPIKRSESDQYPFDSASTRRSEYNGSGSTGPVKVIFSNYFNEDGTFGDKEFHKDFHLRSKKGSNYLHDKFACQKNNPFAIKQSFREFANCKKRRSASLDVPSDLNGNQDDASNISTMEGLKSFFVNMKLRSSEHGNKDKRSLSLAATTPNSMPRASLKIENGMGVKKEKSRHYIDFKKRNSVVFEREEESDDENSASTDVEDSPTSSVGFQHSRRVHQNSVRENSIKENNLKKCYPKRFRSGDGLSPKPTPPFLLSQKENGGH
ncbi:Adhesion G-protein coupled receptor G4 like protein [Argiope bruennichi]|uniref:Adhesion G-protein coupled receptor G4 like protein n=1 Tax=Argiope bruennichi TaxID=94029 RepID=A0A8T0FI82_ARGBR|nr:Adhesion G-protein coupled receptor G4 like protein [Argiope bruennichi]